ncbi:MAG: hypothetical protein PHO63_02455 [Bacilli bacterium]|nr:hypothetical protein [Bacilli bacterium]MDD4808423.1 hypothetical protein [Bacilli bacterium]
MSYILRNEKLKEFMDQYQLDCVSIIVKIDHDLKKAYYVIDGEKIVETDYQQMIEFMNK